MTIYISNPDNLKLMMNLLRDSSRNVQFEAFHVFKVRGQGAREAGGARRRTNHWVARGPHARPTCAAGGQVFVANPNKAKPIVDILIKNREKLVTFLSGFHNDRQGPLSRATPTESCLGRRSLTRRERAPFMVAGAAAQTTSSLRRRRPSCSSKFKTCRIRAHVTDDIF